MSWMCYYKDKGKWVSFSEDGNEQANAHLHARPGHHEFSINHNWKSPHSQKWKTTVYAIDVRGKHQTNTEDWGRKTQRKIKLVWSEDPSLELDLATWAPVGPSSAAAAPPASTAASTAAAADTAASTAAVVSETKPAPSAWDHRARATSTAAVVSETKPAPSSWDPWARSNTYDEWGQSRSKHAGSGKDKQYGGWNDHQYRGSYNTDGRRPVPPPASPNGDQPATEASQAGTQEAAFPADWDDVKNRPPKMDRTPEGQRITQVTATKAPMPAPPASLPAYSTPAQANATNRPQAVYPMGINGCATTSFNCGNQPGIHDSPTKQIAKVEKITNDGTAQGSDEATPNVSLTNDAIISIEENALGGDAPSPPPQPDVDTGSISISDAVQANLTTSPLALDAQVEQIAALQSQAQVEQIAALQLQLQTLQAQNDAMKVAANELNPWSEEGYAQ